MNREELISAVAEKTGVSKKDTTAIISSLIDTIQAVVSEGDKVSLTGFGTFEPRKRAARIGRNPQTGETMSIAAKTVPAFKAGKTFKNAMQ